MAVSRAGNSPMMRRRSPSLYAVHRSISESERPQPRQSPLAVSTMQIFSQGLSITAAVRR
jgi:hypothetical protein